MKIVVTGSSGLVGSALVRALRADGQDVLRVVRRPPRGPDELRWDPTARQLDPGGLADADAVVHLAGAGLGDRRWNAAYQQRILDSRVAGTTLIAETIAANVAAGAAPPVLLSGSAVGWYGETGDTAADETYPAGPGFLAGVVRAWESSTQAAEDAGCRVAHLRTGVVLSAAGGALRRQLPLFRLGLGGRLGSGRQWLSWISLVDEVNAIRFLLDADRVAGPVNLVSPRPVTNAAFTQALSRVLRRPALLPVPAPALRLALDGFADEGVLVSQRVTPGVLVAAGFPYAHPEIEPALRAAINQPAGG